MAQGQLSWRRSVAVRVDTLASICSGFHENPDQFGITPENRKVERTVLVAAADVHADQFGTRIEHGTHFANVAALDRFG